MSYEVTTENYLEAVLLQGSVGYQRCIGCFLEHLEHILPHGVKDKSLAQVSILQRPDHLSSLTTEENGREGRTAWCQEHLSERGRWVMNEQRLAKSSETRTGKETEMMQNKNSKYKTENGQEQKKPNSE